MTVAGPVESAGRQRPQMTLIYRISRDLCRIVFRAYFRWRILNRERVPQTGPVIFAANHASYIDPPLIGSAALRAMNYLARESLFRHWPFGWYLRKLNAVPVDRDGAGAAGLKAILGRLKNGGGIILFPEGTRTRDGGLQPARSGIGLTVIKSNAPVLPVRVFGSYEAWGRHRLFPLARKVTVKYGKPMDFAALRAEAKTCSKDRLKAIYQEVADELMARIAAMEPVEDPVNA